MNTTKIYMDAFKATRSTDSKGRNSSFNQYNSHLNKFLAISKVDELTSITPEQIETITAEHANINKNIVKGVLLFIYSEDVNGAKAKLTKEMQRYLIPIEYHKLLM